MMKKKSKQKKSKPVNWKEVSKRPEMVELKNKLALEGWELVFK